MCFTVNSRKMVWNFESTVGLIQQNKKEDAWFLREINYPRIYVLFQIKATKNCILISFIE